MVKVSSVDNATVLTAYGDWRQTQPQNKTPVIVNFIRYFFGTCNLNLKTQYEEEEDYDKVENLCATRMRRLLKLNHKFIANPKTADPIDGEKVS